MFIYFPFRYLKLLQVAWTAIKGETYAKPSYSTSKPDTMP